MSLFLHQKNENGVLIKIVIRATILLYIFLKQMKFKAAVLFKQKKPLKVIAVNHDCNLEKGQVLVKLYYSGICGSQIGEINGVKGKDNYLPHFLGHEGTGEVLSIHKSVKKIKKGDKVILHWKKGSGINSNPPTYHLKNTKINAGWVTTFNHYAIVSENRITKIPKGISYREGVLFGCAITTAYGVVYNDAKIKPNDNLLIIGAGNLGLSMVVFAKIIGVKKIVVIDKNKKKLQLAKKFGSSHGIEFKNDHDLKKNLIKIFKDKFPNKIIENTGNKSMIQESYTNYLNKEGTLILVGVPNSKEKIRINTLALHLGKKIVGSFGGSINPSNDIMRIKKILNKKFKIKNLLGNTYPLSDINKAIENMSSGKEILKPLIKF